jgi:hypothetical protein
MSMFTQVGGEGEAGRFATLFAVLTEDDGSTPISGETIDFGLDLSGSGSFSSIGSAATDGSGVARLLINISAVSEGIYSDAVEADYSTDSLTKTGDLFVNPEPAEPPEPPEPPDFPELEAPYEPEQPWEPYPEESTAPGAPESTNPFEGGETFDPYSGESSGDPYSDCTNNYTGDSCVNSYTGGSNLDPYGDGACINPFRGSSNDDAYASDDGDYYSQFEPDGATRPFSNLSYSPYDVSISGGASGPQAVDETELTDAGTSIGLLETEHDPKVPLDAALSETVGYSADEKTPVVDEADARVPSAQPEKGILDDAAELVGDVEKGLYEAKDQRYQLKADWGERTSTVTGLMDTKTGPRGTWAIRVDEPMPGFGDPHININPKLTGVPDLHTPISPEVLETLKVSSGALEFANRVALPVAIAADAVRLTLAIDADITQTGSLGRNTATTSVEIAGGWVGAIVAAEQGAIIGAEIGLLAGPVGGIVGGFVGGIAAGIAGAYVTSKTASGALRYFVPDK